MASQDSNYLGRMHRFDGNARESFSRKKESRSNFELPSELPFDFLKKITNDFSYDQELYADPFGTVYKAIVPDDGRVIAIKKLQENAPMPADKTFMKEVRNVMSLKHENIVQIIGYCSETREKLVQFDNRYIQAEFTELLICYEYCPNGRLHENLFGLKGTQQIIDWDTRFKIVKGICQGLLFLHMLDIPIIHMDLKPENIWLDENMVPKLGNFALSRVFGQEQTRLLTQTVVGSYGYMAPEYLYRGEISAKSDVYSLGLMIIQITTRQQNCPDWNDPSSRNYIDKVREHLRAVHISYMYPSSDSESLEQVQACIDIGLKCVDVDPRVRPSMDEIVDMLKAS